MRMSLIIAGSVAIITALTPAILSAKQLSVDDYKKAEQQFSSHTSKLVTGTVDYPVWSENGTLVYRSHTENGNQFFKVDINSQKKSLAFDHRKLADALAKHQTELKKNLKYFIQVNLGNEIQKSGIPVSELDSFYNYCKNEVDLNIIGLMVIPPNDNKSEKYFKYLNELNKSLAMQDLSMGMSADYIEAVKHGATYIRVGSSIFGERS